MPRIIAVATDFSARADRAIDRAKLLQKENGGTLRFIHATNLPSDDHPDRAMLERRIGHATGLAQKAGEVEFVFASGSPPKAIAHSAQGDEVAVLVIGPARYNSLGDYFLGTAVDYVLRNVTTPVLIVKNRAHESYREIVAGTDFSAGSAHAILTAARMFPGAHFHIVHGWHMPFQGFQKDPYVGKELIKEAKAKMASFVDELVAQVPALKTAVSHIVKGGPIEAVRSGIANAPDALVVIGSHGAGGFEQASIGSVTSDLLRAVEADTLVVSTKAVG